MLPGYRHQISSSLCTTENIKLYVLHTVVTTLDRAGLANRMNYYIKIQRGPKTEPASLKRQNQLFTQCLANFNAVLCVNFTFVNC